MNDYITLCLVKKLEFILIDPFTEIKQGKVALLDLLAELLYG